MLKILIREPEEIFIMLKFLKWQYGGEPEKKFIMLKKFKLQYGGEPETKFIMLKDFIMLRNFIMLKNFLSGDTGGAKKQFYNAKNIL